MLRSLTGQLLPLLQTIPPRVPPASGDEDGSALIFLALIVIVFFLISAVIIAVLSAVLRAFDVDEKSQIPVFIAGMTAAGGSIWLLWDILREFLAPIAEWSWIVLLLIFGILLIAVIAAVVGTGLKSSFSRPNTVGTLSIMAIAAATAYLSNFAEWGFWSALGVSFGVVLALNAIGVAISKLISGTGNE